jgi:hypothetical protein
MYYISERHNFNSNVNVTGTVSATSLSINNPTTAQYPTSLSVYAPNMNANYQNFVIIGKANVAYNHLQLVYNHVGDGSLSNYGSLQIAGRGNILTWNGYGNVGIGTGSPAYTLDVAGQGRFTSNLYIGSNVGPGQSNNIDITGATGNIIASGNISAGNLGMFRNRIINGDMRINQRGSSSYGNLSPSQYTFDRFRTPFNAIANNTSHTLITSGGPAGLPYYASILTNFVSNNGALIEQAIEQINLTDCTNGTAMTLSFWASSGYNPGNGVLTLTAGVFVPNSVNNFTSGQLSLKYGVNNTTSTLSTTWTRYVVPFVITDNLMSTNGCLIQWWTNAQCGVNITGVQLEKGSIATPFEFRPYTIELQLCQRYFVVIKSSSIQYQRTPFVLVQYNSTTFNGCITLPVIPRNISDCQLIISGGTDFQIWNGVTSAVTSGLSFDAVNSCLQTLAINGTTTTSMPSGTILLAGITSGSYLYFSNEL